MASWKFQDDVAVRSKQYRGCGFVAALIFGFPAGAILADGDVANEPGLFAAFCLLFVISLFILAYRREKRVFKDKSRYVESVFLGLYKWSEDVRTLENVESIRLKKGVDNPDVQRMRREWANVSLVHDGANVELAKELGHADGKELAGEFGRFLNLRVEVEG